MPSRFNAKFQASLRRLGKPIVTAEERRRAREMRARGMMLKDIAAVLGRVKSTVFYILLEPETEPRP